MSRIRNILILAVSFVFYSLEKKLAARRAKVCELKQKQEELEINSKAEGKDSKKQITELVGCVQ